MSLGLGELVCQREFPVEQLGRGMVLGTLAWSGIRPRRIRNAQRFDRHFKGVIAEVGNHLSTEIMSDVRTEAPSPVVCFLDESGTDDKTMNDAVVGCFLINRRDLEKFDSAWKSILRFYGVRDALHLRDFGPRGRNGHIIGVDRATLFTAAVRIINEFKILAMGASLKNREREKAFSAALQNLMLSSYGLAFLMCLAFHQKQANQLGYLGSIDFVLDRGNRFRSHIERIHRAAKTDPVLKSYQVGSIDFADDWAVPSLQAADVVAWATRRRRSGAHFNGPLQPLLELFNDSYVENQLTDETLTDLASRFAEIERQAGLA